MSFKRISGFTSLSVIMWVTAFCLTPSASAQLPWPTPYKDPFYNNDFSYLDNPDYVSCDWFDILKGIQVGSCLTLDVGGEYRMRFHDEVNMRLTGLDDDYLLQRTRLYFDSRYGGWLRAYIEFLDANSSYEDLPPRTIDENRADFNNLFGEAKLCEACDGVLSARVGRQEMLYGNQRLISPLDWANTRRTFDGALLMWRSPTWNVDGFWTRPVPFSQHVNCDHNFDHPDQSQEFMGVYATWHKIKDHLVDLYYLRLVEDDKVVTVGSPRPTTYDTNTFGGRYLGRCRNWLCEVEGGYQFGDFSTAEQSAGFYTIGFGYDFKCLPWKPVFWGYYDWASGDSNPNDNSIGTFNQQFPLGHKYFGFMDLVGRENITDWNFQLTAKPCDYLSLMVWYHIFHLEEARDALYSAGGAKIRNAAAGDFGTDVGQEIDLTAQVFVNQHTDLFFGYSYFFAGEFIAETGNPDDASFFYAAFTFRF